MKSHSTAHRAATDVMTATVVMAARAVMATMAVMATVLSSIGIRDYSKQITHRQDTVWKSTESGLRRIAGSLLVNTIRGFPVNINNIWMCPQRFPNGSTGGQLTRSTCYMVFGQSIRSGQGMDCRHLADVGRGTRNPQEVLQFMCQMNTLDM